MLDTMFETPSNDDVEKVILTKASIDDNASPIIKKKTTKEIPEGIA